MLSAGRPLRKEWWITSVPGLAVPLTVLAFNLLSDGLRSFLDTRRS